MLVRAAMSSTAMRGPTSGRHSRAGGGVAEIENARPGGSNFAMNVRRAVLVNATARRDRFPLADRCMPWTRMARDRRRYASTRRAWRWYVPTGPRTVRPPYRPWAGASALVCRDRRVLHDEVVAARGPGLHGFASAAARASARDRTRNNSRGPLTRGFRRGGAGWSVAVCVGPRRTRRATSS